MMKYEELDNYALSKIGCTKDFQIEWDAFRYFIGGKIFMMITSDNIENKIINLKCDPLLAVDLRSKYKEIVPGYHMNKIHWNSVMMNNNIQDDLLKEMIDMSYDLVFYSLTKKLQREIKENK